MAKFKITTRKPLQPKQEPAPVKKQTQKGKK